MSKKILIIEDEKSLVDMYQEKLEQSGFKTFFTMEMEEGLRLFEKEKPDLILLDILLPRDSGIVFLQRLEEKFGEISVPILAFSNYDDLETKNKAEKLGVEEYLIKTNYTPGEVVEKIKKYI
jgi:DNA-binding response OmpR family regulator